MSRTELPDHEDPRADESNQPLRLVEEPGSGGAHIELANRVLAAGADEEARAWSVLEGRLQRRLRGRWPLALAALGGVAAVAIVGGAGFMKTRKLDAAGARAVVTGARRDRPAAEAPPAEATRAIASRDGRARGAARPPLPDEVLPERLQPGQSLVTGGVRARLSARGVARMAPASRGAPSLILDRGVLQIDMAQGSDVTAAGRVAVNVAALRVEADSGSRFRVATDGKNVDLVVRAGRASVWSEVRLLASVVAGERWSNHAPSSAAPVEGPAPGGVPAAEKQDCLQLARAGSVDDAMSCFQDQAARPGLSGEVALVELARLRRDVKGDLGGAEQALAEHQRRFPRGALIAEVTSSRVELLLRLGRPLEALAETDRASEDERPYWRARCLANLGRRAEAQQAFDQYLARPGGTHRTDAQKGREDLSR